jgi:hypothetical protein
MKTFERKTVASLSALGLMLLASGCGGEAYRTVNTNTNNTNNTNTSTGGTPFVSPTGTPTNWGGGPGPSTGNCGVVITPAVPAYSFDFNVTGSGGTAPTFTSTQVETDNMLIVRISAKAAGQLSLQSGSYSRFTANYGCIQYEVTALGKTLSTGMLSTVAGGSPNCPGAPTYADLNFSDSLSPGHNAVNIQVTKVYYDFYCAWARWVNSSYITLSQYGYQNEGLFCPATTVYRNHTVNGKMQVKVNGSEFSSY